MGHLHLRRYAVLALAAALGFAIVWSRATLQAADAPVLLQRPTVNQTHVVFSFAGDLWSVERAGGDARCLTSGVGTETAPYFSPDGTLVAFTGEYDGNVDVYVVAAAGGVPRRLTWHPAPDIVTGWTPDGGRILFRSPRTSHQQFTNYHRKPTGTR